VPRLKTIYRCAECGGSSPKWLGRCPSCEAWNTLVEEADVEVRPVGLGPTSRPVLMADVDLGEFAHRPTGIGELDRVLGGGLVPGSVTLVGGEPGIGKSTLLLQVLATLARDGARSLLVTADE
jgi:DNA repair protein RadA/Sms